MYRVLLKWKSFPFETYSEALSFQQQNGGVIYQKIGSYGGRN